MWKKTVLSYVALPASVTIGSVMKGMAYLSSDTRRRHEKIAKAQISSKVESKTEHYKSMGIVPAELSSAEMINPSYHKRRPGEENMVLPTFL